MLLYISVFSILISVILLINNWKINRNAVYLALFLIISSIYGVAHYFVIYGKSPFWFAVFYNHFTPLMLLLGPLLLFYVRGTLNDSYKLYQLDFIHFIPAIIHLVGIFPYLILPFSEKLNIASSIINDIDKILTVDTNYFYSSSISYIIRPVSLLGYILFSVYLIWRRFTNATDIHKTPKKQLIITLRWLIILITTIFFIVLEFLIITINSINTKPSIGLNNSNPLYILSGLAYFIMSISLLLFPNILYGIPKHITIKSLKKSNKEKTDTAVKKSIDITEDPFYGLSKKIKKYIKNEKPYINPDFSINDIAIALNVPQNHVKYCINEIMQTKFATLKNELRLNYAIELLSSDLKDSLTIEGIAKQSGFKTRTSFYNAFKEKTGITPKEFVASK
jgi:AraC-like DNA-binding protein